MYVCGADILCGLIGGASLHIHSTTKFKHQDMILTQSKKIPWPSENIILPFYKHALPNMCRSKQYSNSMTITLSLAVQTLVECSLELYKCWRVYKGLGCGRYGTTLKLPCIIKTPSHLISYFISFFM